MLESLESSGQKVEKKCMAFNDQHVVSMRVCVVSRYVC